MYMYCLYYSTSTLFGNWLTKTISSSDVMSIKIHFSIIESIGITSVSKALQAKSIIHVAEYTLYFAHLGRLQATNCFSNLAQVMLS